MAIERLSGVWPEWQVVRQIGNGSFGVVYEAVRKDLQVGSHAAIKVISIPQSQSELATLRSEGMSEEDTKVYLRSVVDSFIGEIRLMEAFKGVQNIVSVEDYKVVPKPDGIGWDIFIRMELLTPFTDYLQGREMTEAEVIKLGSDLCTALELCGRRNVIHRDIKPENIFVNSFGDFKLGDFGIARRLEGLTGGLSQKGTYNYMAPEVERGAQYDARADIYSLGLVLYRLLNGNRLPFLGAEGLRSPEERMAAVRRRMDGEALPAPCNASPEMARLILCACAYAPEERFASATAMKNALTAVAGRQSVAAGRPAVVSAAAEKPVPDQTVSVRRTPPQEKPAPDQTVSVRKAPMEMPVISVESFGEAPKKRNKGPMVVALLLAVVLLLSGVLFAILKVREDAGEDRSLPVSSLSAESSVSEGSSLPEESSGGEESSGDEESPGGGIISVPPDENSTPESSVPEQEWCTVTVLGDHIQVYFDGSSSPATLKQVEAGSDVAMRILPEQGYRIRSMTVDGASFFLTGSGYTLTDVWGDCTVRVSAESTGGSAVQEPAPEPPVSVDFPTEPFDPTGIPLWDVDVIVRGAGTVYVNGTVAETAETAEGTVRTQTVVSGNGSPVTQTVQVPDTDLSGERVQVVLLPAAGYRLERISIDGMGNYQLLTDFRMRITENCSVEITFVAEENLPNTFPVTVAVETEGGYVTVNGQEVFSGSMTVMDIEAGKSLNIWVHTEAGYELDRLVVDGNPENIAGGNLTLHNIAKEVRIEVRFKKKT